MQLAEGGDLVGGLITDLEVDEGRMRRILEATGGLPATRSSASASDPAIAR